MRVVEIIPSLFPVGGAERLVADLCQTYANKAEVELLLITLYDYGKNPIEVQTVQAGVKVLSLGKKKGLDLRCAKKLKAALSSFRPDIIHAHLNTLVTLWLSGCLSKYPVVYTFHTLASESALGSPKRIRNRFTRKLIRRKKIHVAAISPLVANSLRTYYRLPEEDFPIVLNGVPLDRYGLGEEKTIDFLYVGRFVPLKNPKMILESIEKIASDAPNVSLTMLGEGPLREECQRWAAERSQLNISLPGAVPNVNDYLKSAHFLVLASNYEGNPMVINEAIASGVFVIAPRVGGIPDIVTESTGMLFDAPPSLDGLCFAMDSCLKNADAIHQKQMASFEKDSARVSIDATAKGYLELFGRYL